MFFRQNFIVIPEKMHFNKARAFCQKMKTDVIVPTTEEENTALYQTVSKFSGLCKPKNHATSFMWLGATDAKIDGQWEDFYVCILLFLQ